MKSRYYKQAGEKGQFRFFGILARVRATLACKQER
jgi:hypothetical protein